MWVSGDLCLGYALLEPGDPDLGDLCRRRPELVDVLPDRVSQLKAIGVDHRGWDHDKPTIDRLALAGVRLKKVEL